MKYKPKYRVKQAVAIKGIDSVFRIAEIELHPGAGFRYLGHGFYVWEDQLRLLTQREIGPQRKTKARSQ